MDEDVLANFTIDGFQDDRLPSVDQIAQIIIDPDSLSAAVDGPRIEIVTRPGSGQWRRPLDFRFADESLNARTPGLRQCGQLAAVRAPDRIHGRTIDLSMSLDF